MKHLDVFDASLFPGGDDVFLLVRVDFPVRGLVSAGRRNDDKTGVGAAGQLDELFNDTRIIGGATADYYKCSLGRPVFDCLLARGIRG